MHACEKCKPRCVGGRGGAKADVRDALYAMHVTTWVNHCYYACWSIPSSQTFISAFSTGQAVGKTFSVLEVRVVSQTPNRR